MKQVCALFVCLIAIASRAESKCDFTCLNEKEVKYFSITLNCGDTNVCNSNCKEDPTSPGNYPMCLPVQTVCPHSCGVGSEIIIGGMNGKCPDNKICNLNSCENMCMGEECTNKNVYTCVDDNTANIFGIIYKCPENTVCNKNYAQPCAICINPSGTRSVIRSWMTKPN